jgi:hypothetical protein
MPEAAPHDQAQLGSRAARSPRSAAIAGLLFAILFAVSVTILYASVSGTTRDTGQWLADRAGWVTFAIGLMPFAGIFFLWFMGVVRARLGRFEDQFFSTVFFGSGLIFLAMVFVATGVAGALVTSYARDPENFAGSSSYYLARDIVRQIFSVYALRMAAVFCLSQATLWLRTKVLPRWLIVITYVVSLLLLFAFSQSFWVVMVFPGWVFLVSTYILLESFSQRRRAPIEPVAPEPSEPAGD